MAFGTKSVLVCLFQGVLIRGVSLQLWWTTYSTHTCSRMFLLLKDKLSCLQTTLAASSLHLMSAHTVPHTSLRHTSTLPSYCELLAPPLSRTAPLIHDALGPADNIHVYEVYMYIYMHETKGLAPTAIQHNTNCLR